MTDNPLPFNPATLPVSTVLEAVETLRMLFQAVERDCPDSDIADLVRTTCDHWTQKLERKG